MNSLTKTRDFDQLVDIVKSFNGKVIKHQDFENLKKNTLGSRFLELAAIDSVAAKKLTKINSLGQRIKKTLKSFGFIEKFQGDSFSESIVYECLVEIDMHCLYLCFELPEGFGSWEIHKGYISFMIK